MSTREVNIETRLQNLRQTFRMHPVAITFSIMLILISSGLWFMYLGAAPPSTRLSLWLTSQATVIPSINLDPGYPVARVDMQEFKKHAAGKPYLISYWSGWNESEPPALVGETIYTPDATEVNVLFVRYLLKDERVGLYFFAMEKIPTWSWSFRWHNWTVFDANTNEFRIEYKKTAWWWPLVYTLPFQLGVLLFVAALGQRNKRRESVF